MKRTIAFKTLGCRLNQYETEALASQFSRNEYDIVEFENPADVYIVNSCTVTNQSDQKTRTIVNHASRLKHKPMVVVMGCMSPEQQKHFADNTSITYVIDNEKKSSVFQLIDAHFKGELLEKETLPNDRFNYELTDPLFHTRSFIKIQDGCDNFCTYCIIPMVRGIAISRPAQEILDNIRQAVANGYKEIVITGVNISRYDFEGIGFGDLVEKILEMPEDFRLRISSMEPDELNDKFIGLMNHPKLCPHLHICLQSGSDRILMKMNRMYSIPTYLKLVDRIKTINPLFNLTTDIMVGFPGETDTDFDETCFVSKTVGFSHIHTFKYSRRTGTRAERMSEQVPEIIKSRRSEVIRHISEENKVIYYKKLIGLEQTVLVERIREGIASGYGELYVPVKFSAK
ncbi:MAG TPA: tRNA (N(6)-L-threonylcarbamoyladenosine(37)-C(2))-methylthiotransferase MtaB, partial [Bacteroidales bacterium]|nr:tRNA (N(6)-L-threonylcarbamoyladenosine(37)-C(2))-methylthiotransferase MtaB [Bacteroidales bacterium]